jgi:hypothetical protein
METFGHAGVYVGPEAVRDNIFVRIGAEWTPFSLELDEVLDAGTAVVGVGTYTGTCKETGKSIRARVVHLSACGMGRSSPSSSSPTPLPSPRRARRDGRAVERGRRQVDRSLVGSMRYFVPVLRRAKTARTSGCRTSRSPMVCA